MGYRLAEAARDRGARVVLVSGPTSLPAPSGVELVAVRSAEEMARAVQKSAAEASVVLMAAAVSDYRPSEVAPQKIKKGARPLRLDLVRTKDILRSLGEAGRDGGSSWGSRRRPRTCARTRRKKLREKNLDLIVANDVSREGCGLRERHERGAPAGRGGGEEELPLMGKHELAERIWDRVVELLGWRAARRALRPRRVTGLSEALLGEREDLLADLRSERSITRGLTSLGLPASKPCPRRRARRGAGAAAAGSRLAAAALGGRRRTCEGIKTWIGDCQRCKLAGGRKTIVFGQGNPKAELMFVGEAPGADEDEQGLAFVGRAGQLLTDIIEKGMKMRRDRRVDRECHQVPAAAEPQPRARRDHGLPAVSRAPDRGHPAQGHRGPREVRGPVAPEDRGAHLAHPRSCR